MVNLALWLKKNDFKLDQVQTFMPTPMALATTMYHTRKNPLKKVTQDSEVVETARSGKIRKFHKALLRYHAPEGQDARFYGWWGDMVFASHLLQVLAVRRPGRVEVIFHEPVSLEAFADRKRLAAECEGVVRAAL